MIKIVRFIAWFMLSTSLLSSCKFRGSHLLMEVREIDYRNQSEFTLEGKQLDIEAMGMYGIMFCDSFLLLVTNDNMGMIKVVDPITCKTISALGRKGRSRNEFGDLTLLYGQQYHKDNKTIIPVVDNQSMLKEIDFTSSINSHTTVVPDAVGFYPPNGTAGLIDNSTNNLFYAPFIEMDDVRNKYYVPKFHILDIAKRKDKEMKIYSGIMDIENEDYYGAMYAGTLYKHPDRNLFVYLLNCRDYIYYFDLDNKEKYAVHQQGMSYFEDKMTLSQLEKNQHTFQSAVCTPDFFITYYIGGDYCKEYDNMDDLSPELLFFDWDGNYLCGAKVKGNIHSIAYDEKNRKIYGANFIDETIFSYDVDEIIDKCYESR